MVVPGYHQELAGRSIPWLIIHSALVFLVSNEPDKTAALAERTHYGLWAFGGVLMMMAVEFLLRGSPGIACPRFWRARLLIVLPVLIQASSIQGNKNLSLHICEAACIRCISLFFFDCVFINIDWSSICATSLWSLMHFTWLSILLIFKERIDQTS